MKLRIIDLINKIANNEELPKKIKYDDVIWDYDYTIGDYINEDKFKTLIESLFGGNNTCNFINDEVEIIEEDKKIEKIEMYQNEKGHYFLNKQDKKVYVNSAEIDFMVEKINEIIDEINKLKEMK